MHKGFIFSMKTLINEIWYERVSRPLDIRFHYLVDARLLKENSRRLQPPYRHKRSTSLRWSMMRTPLVTDSLGRVEHCAGQMCGQERAFGDNRDSCPHVGGQGESSKREGSMHGKVTKPHKTSLLGPQLGNSTSLLALPVLASWPDIWPLR